MKLHIWLVLVLLIGCKASSEITKSAPEDVPVKSMELFSVGGEPVFTDEFIYVYKKNNINNDSAYTRKDIDDYLDLYVKFKLKIAEAKSRGMDTTASFKREFDTYKEQLKKPYLTENQVTEQLVSEAYERYKQEINASHILIQVAPDASPEDTLKAYNKIMDIRKEALAGADFAGLAKKYSEDPSARMNGGNLGYFTSFQMVYPFESAAYNTREGEISMPVRTRFGYHIIKVLDKRPSQGSVEVAHIMVKIEGDDHADSLAARNKIFEIYDQAVGGVNWDDLARQFSDDINTRNNGGRLRPFKVGQMPYTFQEAAFNLQEPGDISDPVLTPYGWHIIKLEKRLPLESFKDLEASIKSRINRDSRAQLSKRMFVERLKRENGFEETTVKPQIWHFADSTLQEGKWSYKNDKALLARTLFKVADKEYTVGEFFSYVRAHEKSNSSAPEQYMKQLYNNFAEERIIAYEEEHLEDKYLDYRMLVKEYREGILLFALMEQEVWNKAVEDTVGLKAYYEQHIDNYQWKKRAEAVVYNSNEPEILLEIKELIEAHDPDVESKKALEKRYNDKTALTLQVDEGVFEWGENAIVNQVDWTPGIYKVDANGRHNLVWIKKVLPPQPKALDEIRGLVISDYQNYLEKQWVEALKAKYPVKINESGLSYVYEELEK